jgi:hypothetical protein
MNQADQKKYFNEYVKKLKEKSDMYENLSLTTINQFTKDQDLYGLMDLADRELALWNTLEKNQPNKTAKEIYKIVISGKYHSKSLIDTINELKK